MRLISIKQVSQLIPDIEIAVKMQDTDITNVGPKSNNMNVHNPLEQIINRLHGTISSTTVDPSLEHGPRMASQETLGPTKVRLQHSLLGGLKEVKDKEHLRQLFLCH